MGLIVSKEIITKEMGFAKQFRCKIYVLKNNPISLDYFLASWSRFLWERIRSIWSYVCSCFYAKLKRVRTARPLSVHLPTTCNMVTTCLSPVFVQIGAIPSFTATNPTLRLPAEGNRLQRDLTASWQENGRVMSRASDIRDTHLPSTRAAATARLWAG